VVGVGVPCCDGVCAGVPWGDGVGRIGGSDLGVDDALCDDGTGGAELASAPARAAADGDACGAALAGCSWRAGAGARPVGTASVLGSVITHVVGGLTCVPDVVFIRTSDAVSNSANVPVPTWTMSRSRQRLTCR
jgi:hypothetical protein